MAKVKIPLFYHKTDGGAIYLCSNNIVGTNEGSFDSKYIIRIDDELEAELLINEDKN